MPALSITPSRISMYPERTRAWDSFLHDTKARTMPKSTKHNGELSKKAQNRIRQAINWLMLCSAKRNIRLKGGKLIKGFQVSFVTLTLPTQQHHTHAEIKKKCLNNFLVQMRAKFGVQNYIWKMELQKNGNVHFHLSFDKYIHYSQIRKYWNQAINVLGYVDEYADKFGAMSEKHYIAYRLGQGASDIKAIKKAYSIGTAQNWRSPNSTDVKSVKNVENFASYMAKYMAKSQDMSEIDTSNESVTGKLTGRLWFLSTSLSRLKSVKLSWNYDTKALWHRLKKAKNAFFAQYDWAASIYFNFQSLSKSLRGVINEILISEVLRAGYSFPSYFPKTEIEARNVCGVLGYERLIS